LAVVIGRGMMLHKPLRRSVELIVERFIETERKLLQQNGESARISTGTQRMFKESNRMPPSLGAKHSGNDFLPILSIDFLNASPLREVIATFKTLPQKSVFERRMQKFTLPFSSETHILHLWQQAP
jgi:hypothetical protein